MATAFLLWSSPNPTNSHQESVNDSGDMLPLQMDPSPVPAKPKARKQGGAASSTAKRPPQRGLGVAQLERLRLQEHLEKLSAGDDGGRLIPQQHQRQIRPLAPLPPPPTALYDNQQYARNTIALGYAVPRYGVPVGVPGSGCYLDPPPNPSAPLPGMDPNWYLNRCISPVKVAAGYCGAPPPEDGRSMLHGQYRMDRFRTTVGVASGDSRFLRSFGVPVQEPPSTQIRQCHSANCEFCERKKRLFGDDPIQNIMHAGDYFDGNAAASGTTHQEALEGYGSYERRKDKSMKEFEFFPASPNSRAAPSEGLVGYASSASDSMAAASGDAFCTSSTSSHSSVSPVAVVAAAAAPSCLDLSLKL